MPNILEPSECLVIPLGGAIESEPFPIPKRVTHINEYVRNAVKQLDPEGKNDFYEQPIGQRPNLRKIAHIIEDHEAPYIIITDDVQRIAEHSRALKKLLGENKKRKAVVFTGAHTSLAEGPESVGYKVLAAVLEKKKSYLSGVHAYVNEKWMSPEELQATSGNWLVKIFTSNARRAAQGR